MAGHWFLQIDLSNFALMEYSNIFMLSMQADIAGGD
jgi:hypothetical protein